MSPRPAPEMQAVLDRMLAEDGPQPDPTTLAPAEGRALSEAANRRWNTLRPAMARELQVEMPAGGRATVFVPPNDDGRGAILFVHGGGWAFCSAATHEGAARQLALAAGVPVATFDYRLAPEHPYPAGLEDCLATWASREALLPGRAWSVAGDSAGANLAVAMMLRLNMRDLPETGLLFYGVFDADFDSESYREVAEGPGLTRAKMRRYWDFYAPEAARAGDPCLTPATAPDAMLAALPPLYLNAAEIDPLRSDSERLVARLRALGRNDPFETVAGVVHGFMQMSLWLPQSVAAYDRAGKAYRDLI
ncbi:alpha/beta hydrolase [Frigidibacter sp. MR17.14]|uniref:alpha/beta hydrolase n=1 Tax=Frigidibacter sp. MR17.14 TaxID=3126509 RepID=UPI003012AAE3